MGQAAPPQDVVASILIAAHNAAAFLDGAVSSALGQTCRAVEVVAVDDGSTDGTAEALAAWARRDPRLSVLRHPQRRGAGAARNTAIDHAKGRWLAVLDADDAFAPERIERLAPLAEAAGADLLAERDFETGAWLGLALPAAEMAATGRPVGLADMLRRDRVDQRGRAKFGYLKPIVRRDSCSGPGCATGRTSGWARTCCSTSNASPRAGASGSRPRRSTFTPCAMAPNPTAATPARCT